MKGRPRPNPNLEQNPPTVVPGEGHPDPHFVTSLCLGLREGFWIGYSGPQTHSANLQPDILEQNLLTEVLNGHTAGPFPFPPFRHFRISPLGLVPKNTQVNGTLFFTSHTVKPPPAVSMLIFPLKTTPFNTSLLTMPYISSSPSGRVLLCPRLTSSLPSA